MKFRSCLILAAALALTACSKPEETAPPASTAETAPAADAPAAAAPATDAAPATADAAAPAPAPQPYTGPALVPGVDYTEIEGGQPYEPLNGKVEVVEFFSYICPACNAFEPLMKDWKARQAADVRVTLVPATFRPDFAAYAKAYYAAESLGVAAKAHDALYRAVHLEGTLPGEGQPFDEDKIAAFYVPYGVTAEQFKNAMKSFAVNGKVNRGNQFMMRSQIGGTPSLLVNGKYLIKGRSWEDMIRITEGLVAQERAKSAPAN
jgi:thiol:disulfide interchange protein DsbA